MTDQDRSANVSLRFVVDRQTLGQMKQAIDSARSQLVGLGGDAAKSSTFVRQLGDASKLIARDQGIQQLAQSYAQLGKLIKDDTEALKQMRGALREIGASGGDIDKATRAFKELQAEKEDRPGIAVSGLRRTGGALTQLGFGEAGMAVSRIGDIGQVVKQFSQIKDALAAVGNEGSLLTGVFSSLGGSTAVLGAALVPIVASIAAIALAIKNFNETLDEGGKALKSASNELSAYYAAIADGTTESIKAQLDAMQKQKALLDAELKQRTEALDNAFKAEQQNFGGDAVARLKFALAGTNEGFKANADRITELQKQTTDLTEKMDALNRALGSVDVSTNDWVADMEAGVAEANKAIEEEAKLYSDYYKRREAMAREDIKAAQQAEAEQQKLDEKRVGILQKRDADLKSIDERGAQQKVELEQRTADKIEQITQQAVEAANASLQKLNDKLAELSTNLQRGAEDAQIKAQREDLEAQIEAQQKERDELVAHLRKVQQIQRSFMSQERDAIYDRNFDQLFRLQENKKDQEAAEDESYKQAQEDRQKAFEDERAQTARHRQYEAQDRLRAFQRALYDAQQQYQRELSLQQQAKEAAIRQTYSAASTELTLLNNKIEAERRLRTQAAIDEINLTAQTKAAEQQIFIRYLNEVNRMLGSAAVAVYQNPNVQGTVGGSIGNTQGGRSNMFADGGRPPVGKPAFVNEPWSSGRESFTANGNTIRFPGMGYFTPVTSGNVNANGGSQSPATSNQLTFIIKSNDPMGVRREVTSMLKQIGIG